MLGSTEYQNYYKRTLKELSKKRRTGYIAAIARDVITEKIMNNDRIICFVTGQPAALNMKKS